MLLDPGSLGLHPAIAAIIWKPSITAIAEPFLSARPKAEVDNTLRDLLNSSYPTKAEFALLFIQDNS